MPSYLVTVDEAAISGESTRIIPLNTKQQLIKAIAAFGLLLCIQLENEITEATVVNRAELMKSTKRPINEPRAFQARAGKYQ